MNLIFNVLGTPEGDDMDFISNPKALRYIKTLEKKVPVPLEKPFKDASPLGIARFRPDTGDMCSN